MAAGSAALCEISLKVAELFTVARELVHVLPAWVAVKSKSERGYEIINGEQESPIKASHVDLPVDAPTRDALKIPFATNWTVRKAARQLLRAVTPQLPDWMRSPSLRSPHFVKALSPL